jgi:uncharacterized protein (DUF433 family)
MSQQRDGRIVQELMSVPHIEGRRVDVLTIYDYVEERGLDPMTVADRLDLDVADVHRALAYYYDHPGEMTRLRREREEAAEEFAERARAARPEGLTPGADTDE